MGIVLACLLLVVVFAVTEAYTNSRPAALIVALAPLSVERFYSWGATGTEPKISMILFGLPSLLLISKNKPFWAGVASMLSCCAGNQASCFPPGCIGGRFGRQPSHRRRLVARRHRASGSP